MPLGASHTRNTDRVVRSGQPPTVKQCLVFGWKSRGKRDKTRGPRFAFGVAGLKRGVEERMNEFNVGAIRKCGMMLKLRTDAADVRVIQRIDKERTVRIARRTGRSCNCFAAVDVHCGTTQREQMKRFRTL